jgi:polyphosphate glucokinase
MKVLTIDIGGNNVKILVTGEDQPRKFPSGPKLTPREMVSGVKQITSDWRYEAVSLGYPGLVHDGKPTAEPNNLGHPWVGFDFASAFQRPVKIMNDAAMQALGSYKDGLLFFLGFGTGLGSALVRDGIVIPLELGHISYRNGALEDYVGRRGLDQLGRKKWQRHVIVAIERFRRAFHPDDVVLGGGNAKKLTLLPPGCRLGHNVNAFLGGYRLWEEAIELQRAA